ncbi:MAG: PAS domain S-box protein, partial [Candidatus Methanofastidiosia archaeon]
MQAMIETDEDGFLTVWPKEAEEVFGFTESEVLGWSLDVFIHSIEKMDDKKRMELYLDAILEKTSLGESVSFSTFNLRSDLRAFFNRVVVTSKDKGTVGIITVGEENEAIREYNKLVEKE